MASVDSRDAKQRRWIVMITAPCAGFILFMYLVGLAPASGAVDYTRAIPMSEVIAYGWEQGVADTLASRGMIYIAAFLPAAAVALGWVLLAPRGRPRTIAVTCNAILPVFWIGWLGPFAFIAMVMGPPVLVGAVLGQCDGETWSEGFVNVAALGTWSTLWSIVALVLYFTRERYGPGQCPKCGYDLRGSPDRPEGATCPECGAARGAAVTRTGAPHSGQRVSDARRS